MVGTERHQRLPNARALARVLTVEALSALDPTCAVIPTPRDRSGMPNRTETRRTTAIALITPPTDLGRLWYDDEISDRFFAGRVTVRWVREHLPRQKGLKIGRGWAWYDADILEWIAGRRAGGRSAG